MYKKSTESANIEQNSFPLVKLLPNAVTLAAICLGLFVIRYSFEQKFVIATAFVIISAFLDAVDGRLARFLNSTSDFGAQLDSLADFINFGVAPGFLLYNWLNSYSDIKIFDWALVLLFAICGAIRLARFNTDLASDGSNTVLEKYFFKGIPAPCGASLAVFPLVLTFEFGSNFYTRPDFIMIYSYIIAILMASRVPTISIKKIPVRNEFVYATLILLGVIVIGFMMRPWFTLAVIGSVYILTMPVTILLYLKIRIKENHNV